MRTTSFFVAKTRLIQVWCLFLGLMMPVAGEAGAYGREGVSITLQRPGRTGLSVAYDAETGFDQIYLQKALKSSGNIRLTDSFSDKSLPKWGPQGLDYYSFYSASADRILTCEDGDLFYYIAGENSGVNLHMGCVAGRHTAVEAVFSDYRLTGFSGTPDMNVEDYCVAEGANLVFSYDGALHEAFPVIAEIDSGDRFLILHDDDVHAGNESYAYGYVTYYDPGTSPGQWVPWGEGYNWDGAIDEARCPSTDGDTDSPEEAVTEEGGSAGANDDGDGLDSSCPAYSGESDASGVCSCARGDGDKMNGSAHGGAHSAGTGSAESASTSSGMASSENSLANAATQTQGDIIITNENYIDISSSDNDPPAGTETAATTFPAEPSVTADVSEEPVAEEIPEGGLQLNGSSVSNCSLVVGGRAGAGNAPLIMILLGILPLALKRMIPGMTLRFGVEAY